MRTLGLVHAIHLQPPAHPPNTQYRGGSVNYTDETMNYLTSTASRPPGCCGSFPHHPCPHEFSGLLSPAVFPSSSPSLSPVLRTITRVPISFPFISLSSHLGFIPYPPHAVLPAVPPSVSDYYLSCTTTLYSRDGHFYYRT